MHEGRSYLSWTLVDEGHDADEAARAVTKLMPMCPAAYSFTSMSRSAYKESEGRIIGRRLKSGKSTSTRAMGAGSAIIRGVLAAVSALGADDDGG